MKAEYPATADALYVRLRPGKVDYTEPFQGDDNRLIDYDAAGQPLGVEILDASKGIQVDGLPGTPEVLKAARKFGLPITVREQA